MKKVLAVIIIISGSFLFSCEDPMEESINEQIEFVQELPSTVRGDVDVDAEVEPVEALPESGSSEQSNESNQPIGGRRR